MLWEKQRNFDHLESTARNLAKMIDRLSEPENVERACRGIMRYSMYLVSEGRHADASAIADCIINPFRKFRNEFFIITSVELMNNLVTVCSEAGKLNDAHQIASELESLLDTMEHQDCPEKVRSAGISRKSYSNFIISNKMTVFLNHAITCSRMDCPEEGERYLDRLELLMNQYPALASEEVGLSLRLKLFRQNGLPAPKSLHDSEQEYRELTNTIESAIEHCIHDSFTYADLNQIERNILKLISIPEYAIYGSHSIMAEYYHMLYRLYSSIPDNHHAYNALFRAVNEAESDSNPYPLYGEIYNDMALMSSNDHEKLNYLTKSISMFECLRKADKQYSEKSYALALYNYASVRCALKSPDHDSLEAIEKACSLFRKLHAEYSSDEIPPFVKDAEQLLKYIRSQC